MNSEGDTRRNPSTVKYPNLYTARDLSHSMEKQITELLYLLQMAADKYVKDAHWEFDWEELYLMIPYFS